MRYRHLYDPIALMEYKDAVSWYAAGSEKAANNLIKEVKEKIKVICNDPLRYRNTYKKFRETSLKKYPYSIVYLIDESAATVIIISVYHHKRNPKGKYRKSI
jgi:plasmid stabilization system protein ParE